MAPVIGAGDSKLPALLWGSPGLKPFKVFNVRPTPSKRLKAMVMANCDFLLPN